MNRMERIQSRLPALGAWAIMVRDGAVVAVPEEVAPVERLLASCDAFKDAVRQRWNDILADADATELLPGLWAMPFAITGQDPREFTTPGRHIGLVLIASADVFNQGWATPVLADHDAGAIDRDHYAQSAHDVRRLAVSIGYMIEDDAGLTRSGDELSKLATELGNSYEELSLLYRLSTQMSFDRTPAKLMQEACVELCEVIGFRWMVIQLVQDDRRLHNLSGHVAIAGSAEMSRGEFQRIGASLIERAGDSPRSLILDDVGAQGFADASSVARSMMIVPLKSDGRLIGMIFGGDKLNGSRITTVDLKLCDALASSLSVFVQNAMLFGDMQAMFLGTLHALSSAIDAKDSYTQGHSERVALVSRMLAQTTDMSPGEVERVYIAALLHDVGKIGVPEAVLTKPGKLTAEEFESIRMHPEIGARILRDIPQLDDVIPGVLYHHERWDGMGYPHGLKGEDTPLMGRVIGLADAFDAMSSNRTYRKARPLPQVLQEIEKCAGHQFDPALAERFVAMDFDSYFQMLGKHYQAPDVKQSA